MFFFESFFKNVFCDIVKPRVGSVLKVSLAGGILDHSGIYVGDNLIVELANVDGIGVVRYATPQEFLYGDSLVRTGAFIYVACRQNRKGDCIAMGADDIAERAMASVGEEKDYNLILENCHMFTEYCITGKTNNLSGILFGVELALTRRFASNSCNQLLDMWRSTGDYLDA